MGSPGGANDKELTHQLGDLREKGPISGWRRSLRRGHSKPLQYSCLENTMDRGTWWATIHSKGSDVSEVT